MSDIFPGSDNGSKHSVLNRLTFEGVASAIAYAYDFCN